MVVQSKHFLNTAPSLVVDSLEGLCAANPQLALDAGNKVLYLASPDRSKVALVCGGGSGHEPSHVGFVGEGILNAAVCGTVFASPNASQVRRAIDLVENEKGTLIIVKNYTGDILNFGLAKEQYAATHPETDDNVLFVVVGDDVAVGRTQGSIVGRRGLAGVCIVYKIAGALAHRGASLDEVFDIANWASNRVGTIGVGLEHCHVPGTTIQDTNLGPEEIEIGLGIHNESGISRISPIPPLHELVPNLVEKITSTTDKERSFLPFKNNGEDNVVLLVNNLGGLSELELYAVAREVRKTLDNSKITIKRLIVGTFMTSLNMPGFSITLLLLPDGTDPNGPSEELILSLLDAESNAPAWKWSSKSEVSTTAESSVTPAPTPPRSVQLKAENVTGFNEAIERACKAVIAAEPEITRMDNIAGDGDCGLTLKDGATGVLKELEKGNVTGDDVVRSIITIAHVAEESMGGTSGALYSIFFSALAQGLVTGGPGVATPQRWSKALSSALERLYAYTHARPPSRTLVDPLASFVRIFKAIPTNLTSAVKIAGEAAEGTRDMMAKAGRSAYVDSDLLKAERIPDPGAWGVKTILDALVE
ncbi:Dak1 domain-containing protein [Hygrophoropsis aurantiaca]|uniref:Dak1 domain-containing protein n=1 Tax=Hygrophoropsis aurantiaca TaxID=72124 RepID=A0ACB8APC4_9AGAM|nr:Dak1 domain-containing protein [Hygrophoropsis aurantiaca]